jgi:hypothetical protein
VEADHRSVIVEIAIDGTAAALSCCVRHSTRSKRLEISGLGKGRWLLLTVLPVLLEELPLTGEEDGATNTELAKAEPLSLLTLDRV